MSSSLLQTHACRHLAHFYSEPEARDRAVADWVRPALESGGGAILVCTPANATNVRGRLIELGLDAPTLERDGRLLIVRARDLMDRFMDHRGPRSDAFHELARDLLVKVRVGCGDARAPVRVWGEMVHLLWEGGRGDAAHRLEQLWNEALPEKGVELLCSYDVGKANDAAKDRLRQDVLSTHVGLAVLA